MMRWVALFEDKSDAGEIRSRHQEAHLAYLKANKGKILIAGPLRPDIDGAPAGGLWLFEAETRAEVEALIAEEPFYKHGLRASARLYAWTAAPGFEDVAIVPAR